MSESKELRAKKTISFNKVLDRARLYMAGRIDVIYAELDSGDIEVEEALDEMINAGVSEEDAGVIIENATGLILAEVF